MKHGEGFGLPMLPKKGSGWFRTGQNEKRFGFFKVLQGGVERVWRQFSQCRMRWDFQGGNCRQRERVKMRHGGVLAAHASQESGGGGRVKTNQ